MATSLSAATVTGKALTGFSLGTDGTALAATDTVLQGFQKLQVQNNAQAASNQTFYLGTTSVAINRTSGALVLTGITSIDGSSASCSGNASTVTTNANLTGDVTSVGNATTLTAATVTGKALTGFVLGTDGTALAATDTILQGFQKLEVQSNTKALDSNTAHLTGIETLTGAKTLSAITTVSNATASTSSTTGALLVTGGMGIGGAIGMAASTGIIIPTGAPATTTNTLYSVSGTLYFNGVRAGGLGTISTQTGDYAASLADSLILCNAASASLTITLPASPVAKETIQIKKIDTTGNAVVISGNGKTIDAWTTVQINDPWLCMYLTYDGTQWWLT